MHFDTWNIETISKENLLEEYDLVIGELKSDSYEISRCRCTRMLVKGETKEIYGKPSSEKKIDHFYAYNDFDARISVLIVEGSDCYKGICKIRKDALKSKNLKSESDIENDKEINDKVEEYIRESIMKILTHKDLVEIRNKAYKEGKKAGSDEKITEIRHALNL